MASSDTFSLPRPDTSSSTHQPDITLSRSSQKIGLSMVTEEGVWLQLLVTHCSSHLKIGTLQNTKKATKQTTTTKKHNMKSQAQAGNTKQNSQERSRESIGLVHTLRKIQVVLFLSRNSDPWSPSETSLKYSRLIRISNST